MNPGYRKDLAYIHDVGFGDFAKRSRDGLLSLLRNNNIKKGQVIDLGCGSGIWIKALIQKGYDALGIDLSDAMLDLAWKKAPKAKFKKASLFKVKLPKCDAVTSLGECLNYEFDKKSKDQLQQLFARIYKALKPGGLFIFDLAEPGYVSGPVPQKTYYEGKDWVILLEKKEENNRLTRKMTIFRKVRDLYRQSKETHHVQLYKGAEIAKKLRQAGFRVRIIRGYGKLKFRKAHVGFIATKKR